MAGTNNSEYIDEAMAVSRNLSYNEDREGDAKRVIRELCHRLGKTCVKVVETERGLVLKTVYGQSRDFTFRESFLYRFFGVIPRMDD